MSTAIASTTYKYDVAWHDDQCGIHARVCVRISLFQYAHLSLEIMVSLNSPFCHWWCSIWLHGDFNVVSILKLLHSICSAVFTVTKNKRKNVKDIFFTMRIIYVMAFECTVWMEVFSKRQIFMDTSIEWTLTKSNFSKSFSQYSHSHAWLHKYKCARSPLLTYNIDYTINYMRLMDM